MSTFNFVLKINIYLNRCNLLMFMFFVMLREKLYCFKRHSQVKPAKVCSGRVLSGLSTIPLKSIILTRTQCTLSPRGRLPEMRIYKTDGTFVENRKDTEFGWSFNEIEFKEHPPRDKVNAENNPSTLSKEEAFMESVDVVEPEKPIVVKHVKVNIKTEPIVNVVNCKMEIEGPPAVKNGRKSSRQLRNLHYTVPSKEELAKLINPCNIETRTLMSIIYFAKYKSLIKEETSAELFRTVNLRTTNFKGLIKDQPESTKEEIIKDIQHYYATNEDSMLSLMMEMILADIGCTLEDIVDVEESATKANNSESVFESGDFCNEIRSGRESSPFKSLDTPGRCSILSSIGLDDEDRSLQSFCEETLEMRLQTAEIRESFQEEEDRVNKLIKVTTALKEEVRETLYLDDILHLLQGDLEKVKLKKLPFKIFYKGQNPDSELNLII